MAVLPLLFCIDTFIGLTQPILNEAGHQASGEAKNSAQTATSSIAPPLAEFSVVYSFPNSLLRAVWIAFNASS